MAKTSDATSNGGQKSKGPLVIVALVVLLLILHQDNWFWDDDTLVFGFLPIGLFWHACISIGASLTWALATVIAWPIHEEDLLPATEQHSSEPQNQTEEASS